MNETEALLKMVAPRDIRPGVWRGGIIQIHITRACDLACSNCTQGSNLGGRPVMMTPEQFDTACQALEDYWCVIGICGGNPPISPHFEEICRIFRKRVPYEQRGLWSNNPLGKGTICRATFNPAVSNLNVHLSQTAFDEFAVAWPECRPFLKGLDQDSRHSPPYTAAQDLVADEGLRWELISRCDINQNWSAMIYLFRNQLRFTFCELAGAQSMLHANDPDYPDTGLPVTPGIWNQGMEAFKEQVRYHCHACGIPLRGHGELAVNGDHDQVSQTHVDIYKPKTAGRRVELVTDLYQLGNPLERATDYIENGTTPRYGLNTPGKIMRHVGGIAGEVGTSQIEAEKLIELLPRSGRMLEIGTASGGTATICAAARPAAQIICVDPFREHPGRLNDWLTNRRNGMRLWVGDVQSFDAQGEIFGFELVFIDGGHLFAEVCNDLEIAGRLIRSGGMIAVHDFNDATWPDVARAVDWFCRTSKMERLEVVDSMVILRSQ